MILHRFNDAGVQRFHAYLDALRDDPALPPPVALLTDADCAVPVASPVEFEPPNFANRMEAARFLDGLLSNVGDSDIDRDIGLWSWLTLLFFDQLCPPGGHGRRKIGERARYIPAFDNFRKYYRHVTSQ